MDVGEIEARTAADRRNMTAEERRNNFPIQDEQNVVFAENDGGTKYEIKDISGKNGEYGKGVYLDTDIFRNIKPRNWNKVLSEYVYKNFAGKELTVYDKSGQPETISFARKNERVQKDGAKHPHRVIDKLARTNGNVNMLSVVHMDELLQTAMPNGSLQENSHQWMDEKGWDFKKAYVQDKQGNIYETVLNIANARDGRKILYGISNTKRVDVGVVPSAHPANERGSHAAVNSKKSIPHKAGAVKPGIRKTGGAHAVESVKKRMRSGAQETSRQAVSLPQPINEQDRMLQRYWSGDEADYVTPVNAQDLPGPYERYRDDTPLQEQRDSDIIKEKRTAGALNPEGMRALKHAEQYYGLIRSMSTDVAKIAKVTGYSQEEIRAVKKYIFIDEHELSDGVRRFDPDYMMAESWRRLIAGEPEPHDVTMIQHEILECKLMKQGVVQAAAHKMAASVYNYQKEAEEYYAKIKKFKKEPGNHRK